MRIGVDTDSLPAAKRIARWREIMCDTYLGIDCEAGADFRLVIGGHRVGDRSITRDTSSGHFSDRSRTLINRDQIERIFFGFVLSGRAVLAQAGREAVVGPGHITFADTIRPYKMWSGAASDVIWLGVPKSFVANRIRGFEDMTATALVPTRPIQNVAFDLLAALDRGEGRGAPEEESDTGIAQSLDLLALTTLLSVLTPQSRRG